MCLIRKNFEFEERKKERKKPYKRHSRIILLEKHTLLYYNQQILQVLIQMPCFTFVSFVFESRVLAACVL